MDKNYYCPPPPLQLLFLSGFIKQMEEQMVVSYEWIYIQSINLLNTMPRRPLLGQLLRKADIKGSVSLYCSSFVHVWCHLLTILLFILSMHLALARDTTEDIARDRYSVGMNWLLVIPLWSNMVGGGRCAGPLLPAAMGSIPSSQQAIYLIGPGIQRMSEFQHLEEAGN